MILVINAGSSSIKFQLFNNKENSDPISILEGLAERIGIDGVLTIKFDNQKYETNPTMTNHQDAINNVLNQLISLKAINDVDEITAVGFRVVHGMDKITSSTVIDDSVLNVIKEGVKLAPLHNPAGITAIEAVKATMPHAKLVGCFDTAFHQTIPAVNHIYPVPISWYKEHAVRKYGFHGISYDYITHKLAKIYNKPIDQINAVVCHLGNGASITCVKDGKSFDTSMGLTPLAGLMMGTRSGDIDPSIIQYMMKELNQSIDQVTNTLNKESGLAGISGISADMRDVQNAAKNNDQQAQLTLDIYARIVADFIVKYANYLKINMDAIVFTAGVGENSAITRKAIIDKVSLLNVGIDDIKNEQSYDDWKNISSTNIDVLAIRTNEELMICLDTIKLTKK